MYEGLWVDEWWGLEVGGRGRDRGDGEGEGEAAVMPLPKMPL